MRVADLRLPFFASTIGNATGEPAIVLPGGPCRGPEYLGDFAGIGNDRSLVVLHPRGTPRSGGLSRGWWADAADVVTLADALGLESIDLVAHSAGTRLALATATQFPDRVRSMALITPPATWLTGTKSDTDTLAATYAAPEAVDALAAMSTDNPATEAQFRPSVMTPERIATAERMRDDHQSWESIGRVLGVGASSVRRALALTDARKDRSGERSKHLG